MLMWMLTTLRKRVVAVLVLHALAMHSVSAIASEPDQSESVLTAYRYLDPEKQLIDFEHYKGRWVLLDFFAVWCPACRANVAHMNELSGQARILGVEVVSLTKAKGETLAKFLERTPLQTELLVDHNGETTRSFQIGGYPQAVIINPDGQVHEYIDPRRLNDEHLKALVEGNLDPALPISRHTHTGDVAEDDWDDSLYSEEGGSIATAVLRYTSEKNGAFLRFDRQRQRIVGDGVRLRELLQFAYGVDSYRLVDESHVDAVFRVSVSVPSKSESDSKLFLQSVLEHSLGLHIDREEREVDVVLIRNLDLERSSSLSQATEGEPDGFAGPAGFLLQRVGMEFVTQSMSRYIFGMPVIDRTGRVGVYDMQVFWEPGDRSDAEDKLREAGFDFEYTKERMPVIRVVLLDK